MIKIFHIGIDRIYNVQIHTKLYIAFQNSSINVLNKIKE